MANEKHHPECALKNAEQRHHPVVISPKVGERFYMMVGLADENREITEFAHMNLEQAQRFVESVNRQWGELLDRAIAFAKAEESRLAGESA